MNLKWDERFLQLAKHISGWSKDPSSQVGAVVVQPQTNLVVGLGYNGFPRGVIDDQERYNNREIKYTFIVHAEVNALLMAGPQARGAILYIWPTFYIPPICNECCKIAIQAGITEIVGYDINTTELGKLLRWKESILIARSMCDEAGVKYKGIPTNG